MALLRHVLHSLLLVALAAALLFTGNVVWVRSGHFLPATPCFLLALTYLCCIAFAWLTPSRWLPLVGIAATILFFGGSIVISSGGQFLEASLALVAFSYISWSTLQTLTTARLSANYSVKRTADVGLR